ncbi:MAG: gliding motility-associated C-terminal domain-containing protein [Bacteroidia bacterium]
MKKIAFVAVFFSVLSTCFAQRGKNGNVIISASQVVNEYTTLTADANAGATSITVANSGLNTDGRFSANLSAGDLVMIIQMQGATINGMPQYPWFGGPNFGVANDGSADSTYGAIISYNNCGNYEFAEVSSVPNATTIQFDCGLTYNYTALGRVQVIRVPRYNNLTINNGDSIKCAPWDSAEGGIVAIEVLGNTIINGAINVSGFGFRGGLLSASMDSSGWGIGDVAMNAVLMSWGKEKGEGIAGFIAGYDQYGGRYGKGAPANGGGGGNAQNSGGGGGANGGNPAGWIDGKGNPDVTTSLTYKTAWNLEDSWLSAFTESGGGRGGYSFSGNAKNPLTTGPNNAAWGGDSRDANGGWGGRPLDYDSLRRIFIGGGGGAGDQNNDAGGAGGNGGGMVYLISYGTVTGSGQILANGSNGYNSTENLTEIAGDGAGGAGGGGTVIINSTGNISGISIHANGGNGGDQVVNAALAEAEGPGGGGGGGFIATSNAGVAETATGGANGTTNSSQMKKFPPNGATKGDSGTTGATVTNFKIVAKNDTICSGQTATLNASLSGTVPAGEVINWFSTSAGGAPIASGATYVTGALTKDTVIYVGTCPGTYRQADSIIISGSSSISITAPVAICHGGTANLNASGGTAYSWSPAISLSNPAIANPVASPTATTTYTVNITTPCGMLKDSVVVTVSPVPSVTLSSAPSDTICAGNTATLTASGGTTYAWNTSATSSSISVTPAITTAYSVNITNAGCTKDTSIKVTVNPLPGVTFSGATSICTGSSTTITATGGGTYSWNTSATTAAINVSPAATTTYSVDVTKAGCTKDTSIKVTVNPLPSVTFIGDTAICLGSSTAITASGGGTYSWNTSATTATIDVSPGTATTYSVDVTDAGCVKDTSITVNVKPKPAVSVNPPSPGICTGGNVTLTASGANTYSWSTGVTTSSINVNPAATTTYSVIGTSALGCADTANVTVTVGSSITAAITGKDTICSGSSTTLTASGGSSYLWSNGSTNAVITISPAADTTYSVTASSGSCVASANVMVKVNPSFTIGLTGNSSICPDSSTTITASGGGTYLWAPGGQTTAGINVNPASTTTYSVQVNNGGCIEDTSITVTINTPPSITITKDSTLCSGESVILTASGGGTYSWSNGATSDAITVTPAVTTVYSVIISNGCPKDTSTKITVNPTPTVTISGNNSICTDSSTTLTANGGTTYLWLPGGQVTANIVVNPASTETYSVIGTSASGCKDITNVTVTVNSPPIVSITGDSTICSGKSVALTATGGGTYLWSNSDTTSTINVTPIATTTYSVKVNNGCLKDASTTITVIPSATVTISGLNSICEGDNTTLTASGGNTYVWNTTPAQTTAAITAAPTTSTLYTVIGYNGSGCNDTVNEIVTVIPKPIPDISPPAPICQGASASLNASGGNSYAWTPATGLSTTALGTVNASPNVTTTYTVTVTTNGCSATDSVTVIVNPLPSGVANGGTSIYLGSSTPLSVFPVGSGETYAWSPSSSLNCSSCSNPVATPSVTTTYFVTITDSDGCIKTDSVEVIVTEKCGDIFIPEAFSPGQVNNNVLYVRGDCIKTMDFVVFDRWGNKVFESTNPSNGWDGKYNGLDMNAGTYVYYLKGEDIYDNKIEQKGNVALVR